MIKLLNIFAWAALVLLVLPSIFYLAGQIQIAHVHSLMGVATVVWFAVRILTACLKSKTAE